MSKTVAVEEMIAMTLSAKQIEAVGAVHELAISTYRADGTFRKPFPIWVVRVGDDLYIRAAFGPEAAWYRRAVADDRLHIEADDVEAEVRLQRAADAATNAAVDAAYRSKYSGSGTALDTMVSAPATQTTVRIVS